MHNPTRKGLVIVLNGFPGTGKLTILKKTKTLLPASAKTCLLDNHLLIDPASAIIPDRSEAHHNLRRLIRAPVFNALKQMAGYTIILMTACLAAGNDRDADFLEEHLDIVRGSDVPLFWINAYCDVEELERRVGSPERCMGSKTKLTDVDVLRKLVSGNSLIEPRSSDGSVSLAVVSLDASGSVEESVARLMDLVCLEV